MSVLDGVRSVLASTLQVGGKAAAWGRDTQLLGVIPELDSMAVVQVINGLEEQFGISVSDDEIDAETFATLGSLADFVERKQA